MTEIGAMSVGAYGTPVSKEEQRKKRVSLFFGGRRVEIGQADNTRLVFIGTRWDAKDFKRWEVKRK